MSKLRLNYGDLTNRAHPLNRGLVSWWLVVPWYASGPRWIDVCERRHGTLTNGPFWGTASRPGAYGEVRFAGGDDVVVPASSLSFGAGDFTLSGWVYSITAGGGAHVLIANDNDANTICSLRVNPEAKKAVFQVRDTAGAGLLTLTGTTNITDGWAFLCGTRLANTFRLYVNGVEEANGTSVASVIDDNNWRLGNRVPGTHGLNGRLDDVRAYRGRTLSADDVKLLHRYGQRGYARAGLLNTVRVPRLAAAAAVVGTFNGPFLRIGQNLGQEGVTVA